MSGDMNPGTDLPKIDSSVSLDEGAALRKYAEGAVVLEVGSWRGFSTIAMAGVARVVHAVDHHLGDEHAGHDESLAYLMQNLDVFGVRERVVVHVGSSEVVLPLFPRGYFDLAFVDAFHTEEAVRRDADLVIPLVRAHGLVAFHDYGDERFGVTAAVDRIPDLVHVETVGSLWIGRKRW